MGRNDKYRDFFSSEAYFLASNLMHIPCILKVSSDHRTYEFKKSSFGVLLKQEVFVKGSGDVLISHAYCKRISILKISFSFEKNYTLKCFHCSTNNYSFEKSILHCIPFQVSKKRKWSTCTLVLEMCTTLSFLPYFLLYLFNQVEAREPFSLFKSEKLVIWNKNHVLVLFRNIWFRINCKVVNLS